MQDDRSCGCGCDESPRGNCGCGNNGCCGDSGILFFIIIFLLLFTNCGCGNR